MRAADIAAVTPLVVQLGYDLSQEEVRNRFLSITAESAHAVWVAETRDDVVGFLHAFLRPALEKPVEIIIQAMVVDLVHRKSGIGERLIAQTEEWAESLGCQSIALASHVDRTGAHAFYARLGFQTVATSRLLRKEL